MHDQQHSVLQGHPLPLPQPADPGQLRTDHRNVGRPGRERRGAGPGPHLIGLKPLQLPGRLATRTLRDCSASIRSTSASLAAPSRSARRRQCPTTHGFPPPSTGPAAPGRTRPYPAPAGGAACHGAAPASPAPRAAGPDPAAGRRAGPRTPGPGNPTACAGRQNAAPAGPPARPSRSDPPSRRRDGGVEPQRAPHSGSGADPRRPPPSDRHTALPTPPTREFPRQRGWVRPISSATMSSGLSNTAPAHSDGPSRISTNGIPPWYCGPIPRSMAPTSTSTSRAVATEEPF